MAVEPPTVVRPPILSRVLGSVGIAIIAVIALHWSRQIALGVPDAYPGQSRGGLLLALAVLTSSAQMFAAKSYLRLVLAIISLICAVAAAMYLVFS